jgi:hypothetical protein
MSDIEVPRGETPDAQVVGLHLARSEDIPIEQAKKTWKESILEHWRKQGVEFDPNAPFMSITMPCGERVEYQTFEDIPDEDVPCTCGNPNHWFVRHAISLKVSKN